MTDQQTMLQAVSNAQRILDEYLEPRLYTTARTAEQVS
jgi:hypothetical protein